MTTTDLANLRKQRGVSQVEIARRMGIPQPSISRMEKGKFCPTLKFVNKYLNALSLELTAKEIFGRDNNAE